MSVMGSCLLLIEVLLAGMVAKHSLRSDKASDLVVRSSGEAGDHGESHRNR